jgi:hypothetical protein
VECFITPGYKSAALNDEQIQQVEAQAARDRSAGPCWHNRRDRQCSALFLASDDKQLGERR